MSLTEAERQEFIEVADKCVAGSLAAEEGGAELDEETATHFIDLLSTIMDKYEEISGIRYGGRLFFLDYDSDEEGEFVSGARWIDDQFVATLD